MDRNTLWVDKIREGRRSENGTWCNPTATTKHQQDTIKHVFTKSRHRKAQSFDCTMYTKLKWRGPFEALRRLNCGEPGKTSPVVFMMHLKCCGNLSVFFGLVVYYFLHFLYIHRSTDRLNERSTVYYSCASMDWLQSPSNNNEVFIISMQCVCFQGDQAVIHVFVCLILTCSLV